MGMHLMPFLKSATRSQVDKDMQEDKEHVQEGEAEIKPIDKQL